MLPYYSQKTANNSELLIVEGTMVLSQGGLWENVPMLYTDVQIQAWKQIVDGVHSVESTLTIELFNFGIGVNLKLLKDQGLKYLGRSAIHIDENYPNKLRKHEFYSKQAFTLHGT